MRVHALHDLSAVVTGLLLALTLPAGLPVWQAVLGSVFAIAIAKQLYGGLGYNPFNPALVGRAFLLVSFTATMTAWTPSTWLAGSADNAFAGAKLEKAKVYGDYRKLLDSEKRVDAVVMAPGQRWHVPMSKA
ncbi:MAG TPA: RnfABCDGE type electron transport complex subunit D, partial [Armatimonadota bacterium]|nr:RnfABCDGE type electron transport complex subunit D [Armatimonadota bacterium]